MKETMSCRHWSEFASFEAVARLMPSFLAIAVTVAPEASAAAIRARRVWRAPRRAIARACLRGARPAQSGTNAQKPRTLASACRILKSEQK
jgi:hypothetical protein